MLGLISKALWIFWQSLKGWKRRRKEKKREKEKEKEKEKEIKKKKKSVKMKFWMIIMNNY